jgi:hypothetical protein
MASVPLSSDTLLRLKAVFPPREQAEAEQLLAELCGSNLPFCEDSDPTSLERVRFAALKVSAGNLSELYSAVELANIDWRDLLVAAEFADDVEAHRSWFPTVIPPSKKYEADE